MGEGEQATKLGRFIDRCIRLWNWIKTGQERPGQ